MRSVVTVTIPSASQLLTTLARVKSELSITTGDHDEILESKISEASSDIEAHLGLRLARETVSETFWGVGNPEYVLLERTPVASISSVTVDGETISSSLWRLDPATGAMFALDSSGCPTRWDCYRSMVVSYVAGHLLPDETARTLPPAIEAAAVDLVQSYWFARGRDGLVKSEAIPGVATVEYWVGAVGKEGSLPPSVVAKLAPFRRVRA